MKNLTSIIHWVDASERLPELKLNTINRFLIVVNIENALVVMGVCRNICNIIEWEDITGNTIRHKIKYWAELPQLPESEGK